MEGCFPCGLHIRCKISVGHRPGKGLLLIGHQLEWNVRIKSGILKPYHINQLKKIVV